MKKIALIALIFTFCAEFANAAATRTSLGTFGDWNAYKMKESEGNVCYIASVPQKSEGKYKKRGEVFLIVAHRPAKKTFNTVSLTAGYKYKKGSDVKVKIDKNKEVELFTNEDTAWTKTAEQDNQLVSLMRAGDVAVFTGKSALGNTTTDTFSLKGFTKAMKAIDKACGKK